MPIDYKDYPANWKTIRRNVLLRAGGDHKRPEVKACCETCGVQNYSVGYYDKRGRFLDVHYFSNFKKAQIKARLLKNEKAEKYMTIVLAIAHVHDPDPMNCDMDNLKALCQRCHNGLDVDLKEQHENERKRKKMILSGQLHFLSE